MEYRNDVYMHFAEDRRMQLHFWFTETIFIEDPIKYAQLERVGYSDVYFTESISFNEGQKFSDIP